MLLPCPDNVDDVARHLRPMVCKPDEETQAGKKTDPEDIVRYLEEEKIVEPDHSLYEVINQHLYLRACNQVNEACNKIWTSCELHFHLSKHDGDEVLCDTFHPGFLPSSTIPTLHYANLSALLSILSFFGVGSYRVAGKGRPIFYDLVRTTKGFLMEERKRHINALTGRSVDAWHVQVAALYEGMLTNGIKLPEIDLNQVKKLRLDRAKLDYELLTRTTMAGVFGEKQFFKHLPHVISVITTALTNLQILEKPLRNKCDVRFKKLVSRILPLGIRHLSRFGSFGARLALRAQAKRVMSVL